MTLIEMFETLEQVAVFIHWVEGKHPEIVEEFNREIVNGEAKKIL